MPVPFAEMVLEEIATSAPESVSTPALVLPAETSF
jgi:hypothetical protein